MKMAREMKCLYAKCAEDGRSEILWILDLVEDPRASEGPVVLYRGDRNTQGLSRLLVGHAHKISELHHFGLARVSFGKSIQYLVDRQQLRGFRRSGQFL